MQHAPIMVEMGTMKVSMGALHPAARLPSAALLSWASLSDSELSQLLLNLHSDSPGYPGGPFSILESSLST